MGSKKLSCRFFVVYRARSCRVDAWQACTRLTPAKWWVFSTPGRAPARSLRTRTGSNFPHRRRLHPRSRAPGATAHKGSAAGTVETDPRGIAADLGSSSERAEPRTRASRIDRDVA